MTDERLKEIQERLKAIRDTRGISAEWYRDLDNALAEVERLTRVIAEAVRLTDEYLEDEDSLVTDDPFTEGTCQVASEIRAILKGES